MGETNLTRVILSTLMLRRPITTIKLTPEDVLEYDDSLSSTQTNSKTEAESESSNVRDHQASSNGPTKLKKSRNERLGVE